MMKKLIFSIILIVFLISLAFSQINVICPVSEEKVKSADDYATLSFQDSWDMNERTDFGWFIFNVVDNPHSNLENITFQNGIFSADSTSNDPNIFVLDTGIPGTAFLGKIGTNYPINGDKYKMLAFRMKLDSVSNGQILWSTNTIYNGMNTSNGFWTYDGWYIYIVDITELGTAVGDPWGGNIDSLRIDPTTESGEHIEIDWVRLVNIDSSLYRNLEWEGNIGNVDIYLDDDNNFSNGFLGKVAKNVSGNSYSLYVGALSPGNYYVGVCETGVTASISYSTGYYYMNDIPIFRFLSPSEEGSDNDFASVQLNDAWDMDTLSDIDRYNNLSSLSLQTINAEDDSGNTKSNVQVLKGTNSQNNRDPLLYPLWWNKRGYTYHIDSDHYRILTFQMGLTGHRDIQAGSIARVIWRINGEVLENASQDIILRHKQGSLVINKVITDMKLLPLGSGTELSDTGWNGLIDGFRVDPHEFLQSRDFYIEKIKLASFERCHDSYTITWEYNDNSQGILSLSLFYDHDNSDFNGTEIISDLDPVIGEYTWNTSLMAEGEYYLYAVITDGTNSNRIYSKWPVVIDHSYNPDLPKVELSRSTIYFGVTNNGNTITSPQDVLVNIENNESINWAVSSNRDFIEVNPASGIGTEKFTVSIKPQDYWIGSYDGTITVQSSEAMNSPQYVRVFFEVYSSGTTAAPFGSFDTPVNNSNVFGSIPVTGWALDDIEVETVLIKREPVASDPPEVIGADGLIYIGDAVFVEGSRPDVEAIYSTYPLCYRAGWGYMLLTNALPDGGNGTFVLHAIAYDKDGHKVDLGTKTINVDNASSVMPFGAIDTPKQGGEASGSSFVNFGWALTPVPNTILEGTSSVNVLIDSVVVGNATYGDYRSDIEGKYPGYNNSSGAGGHFYIDTTTYANGVHTISWHVRDDASNVSGIGSRFFSIINTGATGTSCVSLTKAIMGNRDRSLPIGTIHELIGYIEDMKPIQVTRGLSGGDCEFIYPDMEHCVFKLSIREVERVVVHLGREETKGLKQYQGYVRFGNELRRLPIGSTLDRKRGVFYWEPGPGFIGEYNLIFIDKINKTKKNIKILIRPKFQKKGAVIPFKVKSKA